MDLTLDSKQSKALDCQTCDPMKMKIRNCNGAYGEKSQSPILVNGNVYFSCPRAMVAQDWELGYLVSLFFECRENKVSPYGGTLANTTSFCKEVFSVMDEAVAKYREREQKKIEEQQKKELAKMKAQSKTRKGKK